jgi:hypothetical protein
MGGATPSMGIISTRSLRSVRSLYEVTWNYILLVLVFGDVLQ